MRKIAIVLALLMSGCGGRPPAPVTPPAPVQPPPQGVPQSLLSLHNQYRAAAKLPPLAFNPKLQLAAEKHSAHMAQVERMGHEGIGDGTMQSRAEAEGYKWVALAENVAWNSPTPEAVMEIWMHSPGHRANILGNFRELGASVARAADGSNYWTADFGTGK